MDFVSRPNVLAPIQGYSSVVMICIKASTWALKAGNSKNSNTYSMGKYSPCNHLLGRFQLLPLPTFTHYALLIQSISGCLSLRGKIKIQTDHQIPSQQYRGITEYGEFDWSVCFFFSTIGHATRVTQLVNVGLAQARPLLRNFNGSVAT